MAVDLPLQVATRPVGMRGLGFVEATRFGIGHTHQSTVVAPAQIRMEREEQFPTHWVGNSSRSITAPRFTTGRGALAASREATAVSRSACASDSHNHCICVRVRPTDVIAAVELFDFEPVDGQ